MLTCVCVRAFLRRTVYDEGSLHYAALTIVVGGAGFLWQVSNFMTLPFPFNVVFFPLTIVEYFLNWFVAWD